MDVEATLTAYAAAVRACPHNLLSKRGLEELETRHIPESVAFAATLPAGPATVLDLGTGGGFPGFVIAVTRPDLAVTLLDATAKKIDFLAETAAELGVTLSTLHGRAEELHAVHGGRFDVVVARAVAPLERLVPWALPFLAPGGTLHAIKGDRWADELRAALPVLRRLGGSVVAAPVPSEGSSTQPQVAAPAEPKVVIIRGPA